MRQLAILEPSRLVREGLVRLLTESGFTVAEQTSITDPDQFPVSDESIDLVLTEMPAPRYEMADWLRRIAAFYPRAKVVLLTSQCENRDALQSALACGAFGYIEKDQSFEAVRAIIDAVLHGQIVYPHEIRDCLVNAADRSSSKDLNGNREPGQNFRHLKVTRVRASPGSVDHATTPLSRSAGAPSKGAETTAEPQAEVQHMTNGQEEASAPGQRRGLSSRESEILQHLAKGHPNKIIAHRLSISEATVKSHLKSLLRKLNFTNRTQAAIWAVSQYNLDRSADPG